MLQLGWLPISRSLHLMGLIALPRRGELVFVDSKSVELWISFDDCDGNSRRSRFARTPCQRSATKSRRHAGLAGRRPIRMGGSSLPCSACALCLGLSVSRHYVTRCRSNCSRHQCARSLGRVGRNRSACVTARVLGRRLRDGQEARDSSLQFGEKANVEEKIPQLQFGGSCANASPGFDQIVRTTGGRRSREGGIGTCNRVASL